METWYETNPGDNTPPRVKNVGYIAYDDKFFYAAFEFHDTSPLSIRAPYGDRDSIGGSLDYGGVILDTRNTRRSAILFLANPRGIQYDAVTDDSSGEAGGSARLFTARVDRVRAPYTFTARSFLRVIAQWVETTRDPSLYVDEVDARSSSFGGSVLFAYKLNWQTVLFFGYGDNRALAEDTDSLEPADRSLFLKLSYAFQR